jgi:integral membrane sensor domain MASE1
MSAVLSGLIGGVVAVVVTSLIAKSVGKTAPEGQLRFGIFLWVLGVACLVLALLPVAITVFGGHQKDFWAKVGLLVGFGIGGIYCLAEVALVRGSFDAEYIEFSTPWTGTKRELWKDLVSVELNDWCSWYTLTFRSGKKIT